MHGGKVNMLMDPGAITMLLVTAPSVSFSVVAVSG
jgi:hypothetical protein